MVDNMRIDVIANRNTKLGTSGSFLMRIGFVNIGNNMYYRRAVI